MKELLNAYQLNALQLTLRSFEEYLRQADEWLSGKTEQSILYHRRLQLSSDRQKAAKRQIAKALKDIAHLASKLELQPLEEDPASLIRGQLMVSWANLVDARSTKLKRYGEIDPRSAIELDPALESLARSAMEIAQLFEGNDPITTPEQIDGR